MRININFVHNIEENKDQICRDYLLSLEMMYQGTSFRVDSQNERSELILNELENCIGDNDKKRFQDDVGKMINKTK